jgi:hypothetical protein
MTPDSETLRSIANLFDQVDFRRFRAFIATLKETETKRALFTTTDADVARGRAQMVADLLEIIETSKTRASATEIRNDRQAAARR